MLELAAERAWGAHPYFMPVEHTAFARKTLGDGPLLAPEQGFLLNTDPAEARATARAHMGYYLALDNYRNNLLRLGFPRRMSRATAATASSTRSSPGATSTSVDRSGEGASRRGRRPRLRPGARPGPARGTAKGRPESHGAVGPCFRRALPGKVDWLVIEQGGGHESRHEWHRADCRPCRCRYLDVRERATAEEVDLTGYSVEATDGKIGKVDEATYETGGSYLIVDTGPWIFGNKTVILPAGIVERVDEKTETVFVNRPKEEIANAPEYDEERGHREQEYRQRVGTYYGGQSD